jgi:hypothetical protein
MAVMRRKQQGKLPYVRMMEKLTKADRLLRASLKMAVEDPAFRVMDVQVLVPVRQALDTALAHAQQRLMYGPLTSEEEDGPAEDPMHKEQAATAPSPSPIGPDSTAL